MDRPDDSAELQRILEEDVSSHLEILKSNVRFDVGTLIVLLMIALTTGLAATGLFGGVHSPIGLMVMSCVSAIGALTVQYGLRIDLHARRAPEAIVPTTDVRLSLSRSGTHLVRTIRAGSRTWQESIPLPDGEAASAATARELVTAEALMGSLAAGKLHPDPEPRILSERRAEIEGLLESGGRSLGAGA